jgi:tRNA dimethylallyltransferase
LPSNGRRIVRALEVIEITGKPFVATLPAPVGIFPTVRIGLDLDRDVLDARIEARVRQMWADGFVAEVEGIAPDRRVWVLMELMGSQMRVAVKADQLRVAET